MQKNAGRSEWRCDEFTWWQPVKACFFKTQHLTEEDRWGEINDGRWSSYTDTYGRRPETVFFVFRIKFQFIFLSYFRFVSNCFITTFTTFLKYWYHSAHFNMSNRSHYMPEIYLANQCSPVVLATSKELNVHSLTSLIWFRGVQLKNGVSSLIWKVFRCLER